MQTKKSAVVIGAGVGGLATAIFLAQNGYDVTVFEKNSYPGGRCGQIIRDGHRFDIGATILLMPELYRKIFRAMDFDFDELMKSRPVETLYKLFFENGEELDITTDANRMEFQLEAIEKGSFKMLQTYLEKGYKLYELAFEKLLGRNFTKVSDFINFNNLILLFRIKAFTSHNTYIRRFFKHPHLKAAFTFQNIYVGQSPYEAPALFSMLPSIELKEGSCFLEGGMYRVVEKLMTISKDLGVKYYFDKGVKKLEVNSNSVKNILLDDGTKFQSDLIIANADLPYVYRDLLPDKQISSKIDKMKYSCSAFVFHWGLNKSYNQLGLHNVILTNEFRDNLEKIFHANSMGNHPDFYIYAPARIDPSAAPAGQDTISVIVPVGHLDPKVSQDWDKLEHKARNYVFQRLEQMNIGDFERHIKFEIALHPASWERQCNITKGSVFGSLSHSILQMGYFRPHNRHDKYHNLYFVGGSTHPGSGVPMVLLSAKLVTDRILSEN